MATHNFSIRIRHVDRYIVSIMEVHGCSQWSVPAMLRKAVQMVMENIRAVCGLSLVPVGALLFEGTKGPGCQQGYTPSISKHQKSEPETDQRGTHNSLETKQWK